MSRCYLNQEANAVEEDKSFYCNRFKLLLEAILEFSSVEEQHVSLARFLGEMTRNLIHKGVPLPFIKKEILELVNENLNLIPEEVSYLSRESSIGKRLPGLVESTHATLDRMQMLEVVNDFFSPISLGLIYGGSLSYGPFYNVRQGSDLSGGSDLDVIILTDFSLLFEASNFWNVLKTPFDSTLDSFRERIAIFNECFYGKISDLIMTHRFSFKEEDFTASIHFFDMQTMSRMVKAPIDKKFHEAIIKDYREKPMKQGHIKLSNFDGEILCYNKHKDYQVLEGGVLIDLPSYLIKKDTFYPGIFHNIISPCFTAWNFKNKSCQKVFRDLRELLFSRMSQEGFYPSISRIRKSHPRNSIFMDKL